MKKIWTLAGDETSWPDWASRMATSSASELVRQLASEFKPGSHKWAIDIGCGTGRSFLPLAQNDYQVIGIDPIYKAVKAANERAKKEHMPAWSILAIANHLPVRSQSIGSVFAIGTLFHLSPLELEAALLEIKRVLFVGGEAILHFLDIGDWRQKLGNSLKSEDVPMPSYQAVVTCFCSEDVIRGMINSAGLSYQDSYLKVHDDDGGKRKDWFFHCVR